MPLTDGMHQEGDVHSGVAAGVPYVAVAPETSRTDPPVVVVWHLLDPPRTERAMAAAIPLCGLDAWRVYLGLPLSSARFPEGGPEALFALAAADAVRNVYRPVALGGAAEFPTAYAALREQLGLGAGPLAVVGGSIGSAVAQLVVLDIAARAGLRISGAVLLSPVAQLRALVDAIGRHFGVTYPWDDETLGVARQMDFIARAREFAAHDAVPIRVVVGADDDMDEIVRPTELLHNALTAAYDDAARADRVVVPGMGHALADEPGVEPAPQTAAAQTVDALAVDWLRRWLPTSVEG